MSSRRVLAQPRWFVAHVMILAIVVGFPLLGLWQLDRWDEEKARQARIESRVDGPSVPATEILAPEMSEQAVARAEFQPVTATGTYLAGDEVAQRNRSYNGRGGFDWLTPLRLEDGTAVLVRRGFVPPQRVSGVEPTVAAPPSGEVTVTGWLEASDEQPTGLAPTDPDTGTLATMFHADVPRIDQQTEADLLPMILHLATQSPTQPGRLPLPQPVPAVDTTQNLSYALQWFGFTAIALVGYAFVLRSKWNERAPSEQDGTSPPPGPPGSNRDHEPAGRSGG